MAARLQLKLGLVAEHDRLDDSPDTLVVVEPSVGSVARSKGNLYLFVTSRTSSRHALEATRLAAETIRNEYYYDESAGIRVCLQKAIATANKRLLHQADRLGLKVAGENGPIGVGVGVVRGNEMYVATVGPAEAYLIRQARLSTLPDPHRERGLPSSGLEPEVWRGEVTVGDSLVLISPNIVARLGADELKDAMVTLHPQSAMEHLHQRFRAAEGAGTDGAIAFEATEVAPTTRGRILVPVRPRRAACRRARPLADPARRQRPGRRRRDVGGGRTAPASRPAARSSGSSPALHDFLPRRKPAYRRVTPLASRRETQRRAAIAVLALLVVVGSLALSVWAFGGQRQQQAISSVNAGQDALDKAKENLALVSGPGDRPDRGRPRAGPPAAHRGVRPARHGRGRAYQRSRRRPRSARTSRPCSTARTASSLVASTPLFTFTPAEGAAPFDLQARSCVATTAPRTSSTVRRTRSIASTSSASGPRTSLRDGRCRREPEDGRAAVPGGRWPRPADPRREERPLALARRRTTPARARRTGSPSTARPAGATTSWPSARTCATSSRGLYNLYVIDPSEQQIRHYPPASDGGGFPAKSSAWLATARAVDKMTSHVHRRRHVHHRERRARPLHLRARATRGSPGSPATSSCGRRRTRSWSPGQASGTRARVYTFDRENARLIAYDKAERRLRRPVPARRGRWLGGPPRHVRHRRGRGGAGHRWSGCRAIPSTRRSSRPCRPPTAPRPRRRGSGAPSGSPSAAPSSKPAPERCDPAPRRQPDPADTGRHARADRRVRGRLRGPARDPGQRRRRRRWSVRHEVGSRARRARRGPERPAR